MKTNKSMTRPYEEPAFSIYDADTTPILCSSANGVLDDVTVEDYGEL